jgi:uncharacterized protein with HEPN domain
MAKRPDSDRLRDILDAAAELNGFVLELDFDGFMASLMTRKAALWQLAVIGEAAANVSKDLRLRCPQIPWVDISDFRNFVIHEYFGIDWSIVWHVATQDMPAVVTEIVALLPDLPTGT